MQMKLNWRTLLILFGTVFYTGAAVLVVEVAAVRVLTPIFGGSIYVLSSVLSIILFALSMGYFVGGRLADRYPSVLPLYAIITTAGLLLLLLQYASVVAFREQGFVFSPILGPLLSSLVLFFIPAFLLGMDSPYVIKLLSRITTAEESGKYVGTTFFWSTIGSITGSLASGFWLIPMYGVTNTIVYTATLLVLLGITASWFLEAQYQTAVKQKQWLFFSGVALILMISLVFTIKHTDARGSNVIYQYDGFYTHIKVEEYTESGATTRFLKRDTNSSSAITLGTTEHVFQYTKFADLYDELTEDPTDLLVIGGGAYTVPRRWMNLDEKVNIDVVEIEPSLYDLAQKYFELTDISRITNYPMDARYFLKQSDKQYDFIFVDVFNSSHNIPFHLATLEFYQELRTDLKENGVIVFNSIGLNDTDPNSLTASLLRTMQEVFPKVEMYKTEIKPDWQISNLMFIAYQNTNHPGAAILAITDAYNQKLPLTSLQIYTNLYDTTNALVLTDDRAPLELLTANQMNQFAENVKARMQ